MSTQKEYSTIDMLEIVTVNLTYLNTQKIRSIILEKMKDTNKHEDEIAMYQAMVDFIDKIVEIEKR